MWKKHLKLQVPRVLEKFNSHAPQREQPKEQVESFGMFKSEEDDVCVCVKKRDGSFSRGTLYMIDRRIGRACVLLN